MSDYRKNRYNVFLKLLGVCGKFYSDFYTAVYSGVLCLFVIRCNHNFLKAICAITLKSPYFIVVVGNYSCGSDVLYVCLSLTRMFL